MKGDDSINLFGSECVVCDKRGSIKITHGICIHCYNKHFAVNKL